ncbi:MAG TPA: hypothetical protein VGO76_07570 [Luteibacter sp.]|jgi:hypothetical protein|nr:hypothetical protein [Luteibacter sp.]
MTGQDEGRMTTRESFEQAYKGFHDALEVLTWEPALQVLANGNYNTAFELIFDVTVGRYMVEASAYYLTTEQVAAIRGFLRDVDKLPFRSHAGRQGNDDDRLEANLTDMLHADWVSIRVKARQLIAILATATASNKAYFASLGAPDGRTDP